VDGGVIVNLDIVEGARGAHTDCAHRDEEHAMKRAWIPLLLSLVLASPARAAVKVVATLPSLAPLARDVGGDLVEVQAPASPREDPHSVVPRPSQIVSLNRAGRS